METKDDMMEDILSTDIGVDGYFTPSGGVIVSCRLYFKPEDLFQLSSFNAQYYERGATITARLSEIGQVPTQGDQFTISGVDWTVQSRLEQNEKTVKCWVK